MIVPECFYLVNPLMQENPTAAQRIDFPALNHQINLGTLNFTLENLGVSSTHTALGFWSLICTS